MSVIFVLLPLAVFLSLGTIAAFVIAARRGQFDDLHTPAYRILFDDTPPLPNEAKGKGAPPAETKTAAEVRASGAGPEITPAGVDSVAYPPPPEEGDSPVSR